MLNYWVENIALKETEQTWDWKKIRSERDTIKEIYEVISNRLKKTTVQLNASHILMSPELASGRKGNPRNGLV